MGLVQSRPLSGFFPRENPKRYSLVPNVPMLCETRWTAKYKSIRIVSNHFEDIHKKTTATVSGKFSQDEHQLQCASGTSTLFLCLVIIATYSAMLKPVTQALQAVQLDVLKVHDHVQQLLVVFETHRRVAEVDFNEDTVVQLS